MGADIVPVTSFQQLWGSLGPFPGTTADQYPPSPLAWPCCGFRPPGSQQLPRPLSRDSPLLPCLAPLQPAACPRQWGTLVEKSGHDLLQVDERQQPGGSRGHSPGLGHWEPGVWLAAECPMAPGGLPAVEDGPAGFECANQGLLSIRQGTHAGTSSSRIAPSRWVALSIHWPSACSRQHIETVSMPGSRDPPHSHPTAKPGHDPLPL